MPTVRLIVGEVRAVMDRLIDAGEQFHHLVTSPPFLAVRDYLPADHEHKADEIGLEPTPGDFLNTLYGLTAQWGRLLPSWASLCVELGDTQSGSGGAGGDYNADGWRDGQSKFDGSATRRGRIVDHDSGRRTPAADWPAAKSACGIPQGYYLGLIYGRNPITGELSPAGTWVARNWVTWARPNPPVGSLGKRNPVTRKGDQRFRPGCSFITVACRTGDRYFDLAAVRLEPSTNSHDRLAKGRAPRFDLPSQQRDGNWKTLAVINSGRATTVNPRSQSARASAGSERSGTRQVWDAVSAEGGTPPLDWEQEVDGDWLWKMGTASYTGSHYAVFPIKLPRRLILAMCPQRVCTTCGWPSERLVQTVNAAGVGFARHGVDGIPDIGARDGDKVRDQPDAAEVVTTGWTICGHGTWTPGHVLDPFGGSGTTAVAAALEGRDCTLIDFDERNVDLVRHRLAEKLRVNSETRDGDTVVWQVEAVSASELAADSAGQLDLFRDLDPTPQ